MRRQPPRAPEDCDDEAIQVQLSVRDVAQLLNVADDTVYGWMDQGEIPFHRINKQYRFGRAEIFEWAMARGFTLSPKALAKIHGVASPQASLADALEMGGVFYGIEGHDKASVLRAGMERLHLPEDVDPELLFNILLARKDLICHDTGEGIAIPSVRNPIVLNVERPLLTLLFLAHPVAIDSSGAPIRALFMLVCPTVHAHLYLLSQLTLATRRPEVRQALRARAPREKLIDMLRHEGNETRVHDR